ncbi:hypothetical protein EDB92DRAFT_1795793, partial [Lactarius akahatsu]
EPCEVLEAYNQVELTITGDGTHLAPWHTKLGFQPYPAIATLNSISPNGGMIPCLKSRSAIPWYPIAFIEFQKDADGKVTREGPWREKDDLAAYDAWAVSLIRDSMPSFYILSTEEARVPTPLEEADDKLKPYFDWAQRFVARSESCHVREEDMPGHIKYMFDECEYSSDYSPVLHRGSKAEASWLARVTQDHVQRVHETLELELECELHALHKATCPPREVNSFRVLLMRDARMTRRPALCVVKLTCWDVLSSSFDSATAGHFKEGQRFQVSLAHITHLGFVLSSSAIDHESDAHAEKCLNGPPFRRLACVRQLE